MHTVRIHNLVSVFEFIFFLIYLFLNYLHFSESHQSFKLRCYINQTLEDSFIILKPKTMFGTSQVALSDSLIHVQSPGREDSLEEEMATHSSILAWRIPMDRGAW